MPYKSDAQRGFFHANEGKKGITKKVVDEFDQASKGMKLPAKVGKGEGAHPGFKSAQASIAKKEGISGDRAGAILASAARKASPAAKKANPNLKKVKG